MLSANNHPPRYAAQDHSYGADGAPRQQTNDIDGLLRQLSVTRPSPVHNIVKMSNSASPAKMATVNVDVDIAGRDKVSTSHLYESSPTSHTLITTQAQDRYQTPDHLNNVRPLVIDSSYLHKSSPSSHTLAQNQYRAPDHPQTVRPLVADGPATQATAAPAPGIRAQFDVTVASGRTWLQSARVSPNPGPISELARYIDELEQTQLSCVTEYERLNCELASELRMHAIQRLNKCHPQPNRRDRRDHLMAEREYYQQVRADLNDIITEVLGIFQQEYCKAI